MSQWGLGWVWSVAIVIAVAVSGCEAGTLGSEVLAPMEPPDGGSDGVSPLPGPAVPGAVPGAMPGEPPALDIDCNIRAVLDRPENGCTQSGCHGAQPQAGLDLTGNAASGEDLVARLLGMPAQGPDCVGEQLVKPNEPDASLLLAKVDPARYQAQSTCGAPMPPSGHVLSSEDLACFEAFVTGVASAVPAAGAGDTDLADEWEDADVESALSKVKALVNGEPVTAAELSRVQADRASLEPLVREWLEAPSHGAKLDRFLMNALQQTATGNLLTEQADVLNFPLRIRRQLEANLEQAFVRTARRIVDEGRPFSDVLSTTTWDLTPALMVLLAYTEVPDAERRRLVHWLYNTAPPAGAPATPPGLAQSVESGFWHAPDLPAACDNTRLIGPRLFDFLFGRVNCGVGAAYLPATPPINGTDFTDWRQVNLVHTDDATAPARFWDLPTLRAATRLDLRLPRVGFFTTPAFLDNWTTNEDNQFRVTASQTMITALGAEFSAGDTTLPATQVGLDAAHAEPGSTCYACHARLDPMRNYFVGYFDPDYQALPAPTAEAAGFAFRGHVDQGGTLYDFADILATHPDFPAAWVQKLCHYANSQACDLQDPAFQAVVDRFVASNLDFNEMAVALFSSPLVTGLSFSETYRSRAWLISITRQDHLCPRLDQHLAQDDVCGEAAAFIGLIPEDEFARGQAAPIQTAVTSTFHAAAAQALCERLAQRLVGGGERPFLTSDVPGSLDKIVDVILGLPEGHSRRSAWRAQLQTHFEAARAAGASNGIALRSAFSLACESPEVMALGL